MDKDNIYRKRSCELCGNYAFEKHLGTEAALDGGYTRIENFEESGFGSMVITLWGLHSDNGNRQEFKLCPDCFSKIDHAIHDTIIQIKDGKGEGE